MVEIDIIGIIVGAIIAGIVGAVVYYKTKKDSRKVKNELKDELTEKMVETENASKRVGNGGTVVKKDDKVIAAHEREIREENIQVTDSVSTKVRRWHEDPNGSEVVNGRRGFYTDK